MMRVYYLLRYVFVFLRELIIANVEVVRQVLAPTLRIRPGFIALRMDASTNFEITCLANSITLTPGTVAVHVVRDPNKMIIHALDVGDDPEQLKLHIKGSLEKNILLFTRGRAS